MPTDHDLTAPAVRLATLLQEQDLKIVFAESCTGGLVSAALTRVAGISAHHCGSAVVYQAATKAGWLGVPDNLLESPGPVSREVAGEMAKRVLHKTPHAGVAASVTGHLGPDVPPEQDGLVYVGVVIRSDDEADRPATFVGQHYLSSSLPDDDLDDSNSRPALRMLRQIEASILVLDTVCERIETGLPPA